MIKVDTKEMHFALAFLNDVAPRSPHITILENILVKPEGSDKLKLWAMDLDRDAGLDRDWETSFKKARAK